MMMAWPMVLNDFAPMSLCVWVLLVSVFSEDLLFFVFGMTSWSCKEEQIGTMHDDDDDDDDDDDICNEKGMRKSVVIMTISTIIIPITRFRPLPLLHFLTPPRC